MSQRKKTTSSVQEYKQQTVNPTFGSRVLRKEDDVFAYNAWDHAEWDDEFLAMAQDKLAAQRQTVLDEEERKTYMQNPAEHWSAFYRKHNSSFFRDRKWLAQEFPEIFSLTQADAGDRVVVELGCGAGNTMYPILSENKNPGLRVHGYDYASTAIDLVRANPEYDGRQAFADVWDISRDTIPQSLESGSVDIVMMIFVLSALSPDQWAQAMRNVYRILKPGGILLLRDYGRFDMAQLRFKPGRALADNFYFRGDGTRVYFFTNDELQNIGEAAGFSVVSNAVDKRLLVNRKTKVKMYRCWMQAKFQKQNAA